MLENNKAKLVWDFEFHLRKTTTARRPDLIFELKIDKKIWICVTWRVHSKKTLVQRGLRRRRSIDKSHSRRENDVQVTKYVVGALDGCTKALRFDLKKIFENNELLDEIIAMMQRTVLMDSESIIQRVISGLIQGEDIE